MAEPERNVDSNHRPISQPTEIEKALRRNLYELQRLAVFYHKRGKVEQARELYQMMINIEERLQIDYEPLVVPDSGLAPIDPVGNPTGEPS
jgi:hypothetical protein